MAKANKKVVVANLIWRFLERFGAQIVTFIVSIVLARLLDPVVYGVVALVTVFTSLLQVLVDGGFSKALIQKKDCDNKDYSTVFYFNIASCILLYGAIFFLAPLIAQFFNNEQLTLIFRVMSLVLIVAGFKSVQTAYVSKNFLFRKFFFSTLIGTVISAVVSIIMAYKGYGVWALVAQNLINHTIDTIILWITVKWKPILFFSWKRLKVLFRSGWTLLLSSLVDNVYAEARSLVIGKEYSTEDLAFYNKGQQFPNVVISTINTSIDSVLLPSMSEAQNDRNRIKTMMKRSISVSTFIMAPIMIGICVCAEPLVILILTEKWLPCVLFLRIVCITYLFYPINSANLNALKAIGKSNYYLALNLIKKTFGLIVLFSVMWISVEAIAYSLLITTIASLIINSFPNKRLFNYGFFEQLKDIVPQLLIAIVMGLVVYFIKIYNDNSVLTLIKQVLVGIVVYFTLSAVFRLKPFIYILSIFKKDK